ncbi:alpha/beta hydrolase [Sphingobacterium hungaricum]|uniref:BD-FAE-like domain-containing protein n=1 Tax=Sphingobacterium hungaricum TaxID=2082723 RepID=A0A928UT86_9SPHI|nr:alpha/beta hydrolase [Sphingobacterium hungaricum]MBE8712906.1 hypothetical protein [Sphingobacterium hungaricum]
MKIESLFFFFALFSSYFLHAQELVEKKIFNSPYGKDPRQIMDVFLPKDRDQNTPFVILIHGGAWTTASKENVREFQDSLFNHGICVVSINHRYASETIHYNELLSDVDLAYRYCASRSSDWKTRSTGFVMAGVSSGGHLALLYAYTSKNKIKAIVEFSAPTTFVDSSVIKYTERIGLKPVIEKIMGIPYSDDRPLDSAYFLISPTQQIKKIPTLIIHGQEDDVVQFVHAQTLADSLLSNGAIHKLVPIPNAGHDINKEKNDRDKIYGEAVAWIKKYGK